jgi:hypothetical protein
VKKQENLPLTPENVTSEKRSWKIERENWPILKPKARKMQEEAEEMQELFSPFG